jgi:hypothetical protein
MTTRRGLFALLGAALAGRKLLPPRIPAGLAFHVNAFRLEPGPPGMNIRVVRKYDPSTDQIVTRLDVLMGVRGVEAVSPAYSCRVIG